MTVTLTSVSVKATRSLALPSSTYSPGTLNVTDDGALPSFTWMLRDANAALAGPRSTIHVTNGPRTSPEAGPPDPRDGALRRLTGTSLLATSPGGVSLPTAGFFAADGFRNAVVHDGGDE